MAEYLNMKRRMAKKQFTISEKRLKDAVENADSIPIATIARWYEEIKTKWVAAQEVHNMYIALLTQSSETSGHLETEGQWIDELTLRRSNAVEMASDVFIEKLKQQQWQIKTNESSSIGETTSCNSRADIDSEMQKASSATFGANICSDGIDAEMQKASSPMFGAESE